MFLVEMPPGRSAERRYAVEVVFRDLLGVPVDTTEGGPDWWRIRCPAAGDERRVEVRDIFFPRAANCWLSPQSLPSNPRLRVRAGGRELPGFFVAEEPTPEPGREQPVSRASRLDVDVFGTAFFVLTRYEERVQRIRDHLERFPCSASSLSAGGWVTTPVADELAAALWDRLTAVWPGLSRRRRSYTVRLTHDVDALSNAGRGPWAILKAVAGDVAIRRDPGLAANRLAAAAAGRDRLHPRDPFNSFDFLLGAAEKRGLQSHFYFVPAPENPHFDPDYAVDEPVVIDLMRKIAERGHRIGLHARYDAAWRADGVASDHSHLRRAMSAAGIRQEEIGGRHHYLRWRPECSWRQWDEAGLSYDSSLGFAEQPGFRCGTSHVFPAWDFDSMQPLRLLERPLIVMDSSLYNYLRLGHSEAIDLVRGLAQAVRRHDGSLVLLWHNHNLLTKDARDAFAATLDAALRP